MNKPKGRPRRIIARVAQYAVVGIILFMLTQLLPPIVTSVLEWEGVSPDSGAPVVVTQNFIHAHNEVVAVMQPVLVVHEHTVVRLICVVVPPPPESNDATQGVVFVTNRTEPTYRNNPVQTAEFPNTRHMYGMWK